jgi:hypothetical protein
MNKLIIVIFLILLGTLNSCKHESLKSETESYKIEIESASFFQRNFTNHVQETPLNINAEKINFKHILAILIKTNTSNIKIKSNYFKNQNYKLLIEQKDENKAIHEMVLNEILEHWNLEIVQEKYKSYKIEVQDSLKYADYKSNSNKITSFVSISNDSIQIKNCDLKRLAELLNSQFLKKSEFIGKSEKINYQWKKTSFDKLKIQLQNDLGLFFTDKKKDKPIFTIKDK